MSNPSKSIKLIATTVFGTALLSGCDQPPRNGREVLHERTITNDGSASISAEIWVDNWFSMSVNGALLIEDSVAYRTERSFNAERVTFRADFPMTIAFEFRDFMENDTGLEYIGSKRQQIGDGGAIAQFVNVDTDAIIAVTDHNWKCLVTHHAPANPACANADDPVAGQGDCAANISSAPTGWVEQEFDDEAWVSASVHSTDDVRPKDGYDAINWDPSAQLIWSDDLKLDNIVLCRLDVTQE